jgi:predicted RNase H-like HicB family nuclease
VFYDVNPKNKEPDERALHLVNCSVKNRLGWRASMDEHALRVEVEAVLQRGELAAAAEQYWRDVPRRFTTATARRMAWRRSLAERAGREQYGADRDSAEAVEVWWAARAYSAALPPTWFEQEAERLAARAYVVEVEADEGEQGETRFLAWHPEFSLETDFGETLGCIAEGATPAEAERKLSDVRYALIVQSLEDRETVPEPGREGQSVSDGDCPSLLGEIAA